MWIIYDWLFLSEKPESSVELWGRLDSSLLEHSGELIRLSPIEVCPRPFNMLEANYGLILGDKMFMFPKYGAILGDRMKCASPIVCSRWRHCTLGRKCRTAGPSERFYLLCGFQHVPVTTSPPRKKKKGGFGVLFLHDGPKLQRFPQVEEDTGWKWGLSLQEDPGVRWNEPALKPKLHHNIGHRPQV